MTSAARLLTVLMLSCIGAVACNDYDIIQQPMRETFYQADREKVDLLFVIDDSPSMLEEVDLIETTTSALLSSLLRLEIDTRLRAVTTSSASLLDWTLIDSLAQLPELTVALSVAPEGSRDELGLEEAVASSDRVRSDAVLHVVIITDEDDRSDDTVDTYTDRLIRGAAGGVRIHPIAGDLPAGCARDGIAADPAPRYIEAAALTDGAPVSICSASLRTDLELLSFDFTGLRADFPLSSLPEEASILVWVDGASVTRSRRHGWRWEAAKNTLTFDGFAVPPPGARIEVEYNVAQPDRGAGFSTLPDDTGFLEAPSGQLP